MNVEALCKSIVDCIISLRYDLMFECGLDMDKARERSRRYYAELTKMHASDPQGFADAVEVLWQGTSDYANAEETVIRMECVGMYCEERLRVQTLHIAFYFGMDPEVWWSRFKERVAYICLHPSESFPDRIEAERGYENLAKSMFLPNGALHGQVSAYAESWLNEEDCVTDAYSAVFFGEIMEALGKGKQSSLVVRTITAAIRHVGVIEGDGLVEWAHNETRTTLKNTVASLKRIGAVRSAAILREFVAFAEAGMKQRNCDFWRLMRDLTAEDIVLAEDMEHRLYEALKQENIEDLANCYVAKSLSQKRRSD